MSDSRGPVIVIASPASGHAAEVGDVVAALRRAGVEVAETVLVSALAGQPSLGRDWLAAGYRAAVAAGGDGTLGAVANHLAGTNLPLGILPLGTGNDVARSLAIPLVLDAACAIVAHGVESAIDLGRVAAVPPSTLPPPTTQPSGPLSIAPPTGPSPTTNTSAATNPSEPSFRDATLRERAQVRDLSVAERGAGPYFLHALTLGLNVEFARLATDVAQRQRWGPLTYAASAVAALGRFRPLQLTVRLEGVVASGYGLRLNTQFPSDSGGLVTSEAASDLVGNVLTITGQIIQLAAVVTPVFGGEANLRLPDVALRDGLLDFVIIEAMEPGHLLSLRERLARWSGSLPANANPATRGDALPLDLPGVWRFQARAATILRPEQVDVTLDGEVRARAPLRVEVAADALRVLLSANRAKEVLGG
ncbi:MAG TPA: diacylglycerol kinase family protein [Ktedonobacterales bacterium]